MNKKGEKMLSRVKNFVVRKQNQFALRMAGVKMEDGDHLLEVLGTIIIAVVILIFFRKQIFELFNSAMTSTNTKVNNLFNDVP